MTTTCDRWGLLLILMLMGFCLHAADPGVKDASSELSRGPYIQNVTPSSAVIVWRTEDPMTASVRYGTDPKKLDLKADKADIVRRVAKGLIEDHPKLPTLWDAPGQTMQYEVTLKDLKPLTTYYYGVYDAEKRVAGGDESFRFRTHPEFGKAAPLRFWVVGDSGTGRKGQYDVFKSARARFEQDNRQPDLYLHVGDIAYNDGTNQQFQDYFFKPYAPLLRHVACWPALGNHDVHKAKYKEGKGAYYDAYVLPLKGEAGGFPSGTENYYSIDYGRVHIISINTMLPKQPGSPHYKWLKKDLASIKGKSDWLIAFCHHTAYSKGKSDSDRQGQSIQFRGYMVPLLEKAGLDVVFNGHTHAYERTMLIDGSYAKPTPTEGVVIDEGSGNPNGGKPYRKSAGLNPREGAVYVVTGHGGRSLGGLTQKMPLMAAVDTDSYGSMIVDIDGDELKAIMLDGKGKESDRFHIVKRGKVKLKRGSPPLPWAVKPRKLPALDGAVTIDGRIQEEVWKKGLIVKEFEKPKKHTGTESFLFAGKDAIYVAMKIDDVAEKQKAEITKRDGALWRESSIELFLSATKDHRAYIQFSLNCIGTMYDGRETMKKYNYEWTGKTHKTATYWSAEFRVPWKTLGLDKAPNHGDTIRINICRNRPEGPECQWFNTGPSSHMPSMFGEVIVTKK